MDTAVIHVTIDTKTKNEAKALAEKSGMSLNKLVAELLEQVVNTKKITHIVKEIPNKRLQTAMKKAREDYKKGNTSPAFQTGEEAVAWLEKQGI